MEGAGTPSHRSKRELYLMRKAEMEDFERGRDGHIRAKSGDGGLAPRDALEPNLLLAILEKLEEIRCGLIDLEPNQAEATEAARWVTREPCPYCEGKGTLPVHWVCSNCGAKPKAATEKCYMCGKPKGERKDGID